MDNDPPTYFTMTDLLNKLVQDNFITSKKVYDAMLKVDRADFIETNPYQYGPQRLNYNVVISAPCLHAFPLEKMNEKNLQKNSHILDIGFGSGYLTVAFSKLIDDTGIVVGVEHIKGLYDFGKNNIKKNHKDLLDKGKIWLVEGDGRLGYKKFAPYQFIHVGAGSNFVPQDLLDQLDFGGRMVIPIGPDGDQYIYVIDKGMDGKISQVKTLSVCYVSLTSKENQLMGSN